MLKCYKGFSLDKQLYEKASTGGVVTTLSFVSVKYGYAKGMVVLNRAINPLGWIVAKTREDLLKASGSTYEDVQFRFNNNSGNLGQVGKPCDLRFGFRPLFSLFCSHVYRAKENPISKEYASKPKSKVKTLFENPIKCFLCKDHVGLDADVSVGDSQESVKVNVLVVRSLLGAKLVELAIKNEHLELEEISYAEIREKQPYLWR